MRMSRAFGKTLRDDPAEAELDSHKLMLRAGMIHQTMMGVYSYLPSRLEVHQKDRGDHPRGD